MLDQPVKKSRLESSPVALFARNFFKYPAMLGSLIPSSPFLVNDLIAPLDWERARAVVEYGPGVGTVTREVLKRMRPDATLVAIELNRDFVSFLERRIRDPRLRVIHGSAADVRRILADLNLPAADCIISCIPYSTISDALRREILEESRHALAPDGALVMFQFTRTVLPYLRSNFRSVQQDFTLLNILPARVFHCTP